MSDVAARVSTEGFVAQRLPDAEGAYRWVLTYMESNQLNLKVLTDDEVADWPTLSIAAQAVHTGGMVALFPDTASSRRLAVSGIKAEPAEDLHLTLVFLGEDVTGWAEAQRKRIIDSVHGALRAVGHAGPWEARVFAHSTFNADGGPDGDRDPCAVYGVGGSDELVPLRDAMLHHLGQGDQAPELPKQHQPFVPHVTAGYGMTAAELSYLGPVRFDRVVVALAGERTEICLDSRR